VLIPAIELQNTLHPILFPPKNPQGQKIKTICLDPGHGGHDSGKIAGSHFEKTYTLLLAQEIADRLKIYDIKIVMTRKKDETLELSDRAEFARRKKADLFVSLHYNAASPNIRGLEVYCLVPAGLASSNEGGGRSQRHACPGNNQNSQNILLASRLQKHILRMTGIEDRGLKRSRFEVLRDARMPAILIEGGFMTNPADAKNIYDAKFRAKMAQSIVDGIIAYKRTVERP
jgi:N-acetylmuramoyl-L-alanine amidase